MKQLQYFGTSNFNHCQIWSPLSYDSVLYLYWKSEIRTNWICLRKSVTTFFRYFISAQSIPILCSTYLIGVCKRTSITVRFFLKKIFKDIFFFAFYPPILKFPYFLPASLSKTLEFSKKVNFQVVLSVSRKIHLYCVFIKLWVMKN